MARKARNPVNRRGAAAVSEWVGGRIVMPAYVTGGGPFRPEMIVWIELPVGLIVGHELVDPRKPSVSFAATFLAATRSPMMGPPRRPARVRVANEQLASELREVAGPDLPIQVAPTPELGALLEEMVHGFETQEEAYDETYLAEGSIPPQVVGEFFAAARQLYRAAPWEIARDEQVVRVDIPRFDVDGACLSLSGGLEEEFGFVLFENLEAFETFVSVTSREAPNARLDLGSTPLYLTFEHKNEVPPIMRREIKAHGWQVAGPKAYPLLMRVERNAVPRSLTPRDYEVASTCAFALASFWEEHGSAFIDEDPRDAVMATFQDPSARLPDTTLTYPYEAYELFDEEAARPILNGGEKPAVRHVKVGRNDPCPCGSGKKYKKCHLEGDELAARRPAPAPWHEMDRDLVRRMQRYAEQRFGARWERARRDFTNADVSAALYEPWSVYMFEIDRRPVVHWFLEQRGRGLLENERAWLEAQRASWLSIWEVVEVEPGRSVTARDLLTGESRRILEVSASRSLVVRDAFLGRVVDHEGDSVLCGLHPRPLPPFEASAVVEEAREALHLRRAVSADRLRSAKIGRFLIARWEEQVEVVDAERSMPPQLQNTDGEDLVIVEDLFEIEPGARGEIAARIESFPDVEPKNRGVYRIIRPGNARIAAMDSTLLGTLRLEKGSLVIETDSRERADSLRRRLELECGSHLRHAARKEVEPAQLLARSKSRNLPEPLGVEPPPAAAAALARDLKERYYADWIDQPIPALDGATPRRAARLARGRKRLDLLLRDMENSEARLPEGERYDFSRVRRELGL